MSAFIFVLILVTLAQYHAQHHAQQFHDTVIPFRNARAKAGHQRISKEGVGFGGTINELVDIYVVTSGLVADNSIVAQQNVCPGYRQVWGRYEKLGCFDGSSTESRQLLSNPFAGNPFLKLSTITNDTAPTGYFTVVRREFRDRVACEENGEAIQTTTFEAPLTECLFPNAAVYTKTPFPLDEASPLALPNAVLKEVPEGTELFAVHGNFPSRQSNETCLPKVFEWFTTGECLKDLFATTAFVWTFDNFQFYNLNFYGNANCTVQGSESSKGYMINQCLSGGLESVQFYFTLQKPLIFEGFSSESSQSSEDSQDAPGQGLGATFYGSNAEESGDTDGVSTTVKVIASVSACIVFVAAVAMYFKGRYCDRKESQDTSLNLDDIAVVTGL